MTDGPHRICFTHLCQVDTQCRSSDLSRSLVKWWKPGENLWELGNVRIPWLSGEHSVNSDTEWREPPVMRCRQWCSIWYTHWNHLDVYLSMSQIQDPWHRSMMTKTGVHLSVNSDALNRAICLQTIALGNPRHFFERPCPLWSQEPLCSVLKLQR